MIKKSHLLFLLFLIALPIASHAHVMSTQSFGFYKSFIHPFCGLDHMLAMFSVGLWASQQNNKKMSWILPLSFVTIMTVGGWLGFSQISLPFTETGIIFSIIVLGVLIATRIDIGHLLSCALVGLFAIFHGHAHGAELTFVPQWISCAGGFILATLLLHLIGLLTGKILSRSIRRAQFLQIGGAAISLTGLALI